jgi:hypothetical protein
VAEVNTVFSTPFLTGAQNALFAGTPATPATQLFFLCTLQLQISPRPSMQLESELAEDLGVPLKDVQLARIGTTQHARPDLAVALLHEAQKAFSAIVSHTGRLTDLPFPLNAVLVTLKPSCQGTCVHSIPRQDMSARSQHNTAATSAVTLVCPCVAVGLTSSFSTNSSHSASEH